MDQTELTLTLNFANDTKRTLELKNNGSWITVPACKKTYIWNLDAPKTVATVTDGKFRGFVISPGILKMTESNTFVLTDGTDPFVTLSQYGNNSFSASTYPRYYITWDELKTYWGSTGSGASEVISTKKSITTEGGSSSLWNVPTQGNWNTIIATSDTGKGAYVNDDTKSKGRKHYAKVYVDLTGSSYAGKGLSARSGIYINSSKGSNYITGLLLFPDDAEVVCENLTTFDTTDDKFTNNVTYDEIMALVNDGCLFLPCAGYNLSGWGYGGTNGSYWSATTNSNTRKAYRLYFGAGNVYLGNEFKSTGYMPVWLVQ